MSCDIAQIDDDDDDDNDNNNNNKIIMVNPCSRIILEELHRQSRNSPHLKKPIFISVFTRTQIMISAIKIMLTKIA